MPTDSTHAFAALGLDVREKTSWTPGQQQTVGLKHDGKLSATEPDGVGVGSVDFQTGARSRFRKEVRVPIALESAGWRLIRQCCWPVRRGLCRSSLGAREAGAPQLCGETSGT
ncbi:unnamed protein product [Prorocentrum cordatum]|uniref:Beta-galactosidase n=1 Tax=Prorocentrum cordatum TaxID=2364126 RepID=A0ABN9QZR6_9DINO|nr:unnamed protein product [Polarella glacialis]